MKNYYILTVDSFQDTFTRIDAGKDFYFELSVQNITGILSVLQGGDTVIVYRKSPVIWMHYCSSSCRKRRKLRQNLEKYLKLEM